MGKDELTCSGVLDNEDEAAGDQCTGQATPRSFLLSSFAFSPGSGNAEGSSNAEGSNVDFREDKSKEKLISFINWNQL